MGWLERAGENEVQGPVSMEEGWWLERAAERALGMSRRLANHSGTGWSLRARRSLPCKRLPLDERLSSLFTACAPVPPP